jgi:hypothetical protein
MQLPGDLHIISFNVPFPADYGGVIDVFEKIKALHELGIRIHLHCFVYNRPAAPELNEFCSSVHYYKRKTGLAGWHPFLPYIVSSRSSKKLMERLTQDNFPILVEYLHCTGFLLKGDWRQRNILIRMHNIESLYYRTLAYLVKSPIRHFYFKSEAARLARYEKTISATFRHFLAVHPKDRDLFAGQHPNSIVEYLPVFLPFTSVTGAMGSGNYNLYHGDLSIADNEQTVRWIIQHVWDPGNAALVIAGKKPSRNLIRWIRSYPGIRLEADPGQDRMTQLIREAHIHLIASFNLTGIKIKMLHSLFQGRHCIVLEDLVKGTALESLCHMAKDASDFRRLLSELRKVPFGSSDLKLRNEVLLTEFDNQKNALQLLQYFSDSIVAK